MELDRLHRTLEGARDASTVRRVYGDPVERGGALVIPAAAVRGGGGGGGGGGPQPSGEIGEGSGFGFGMEDRPVGAIALLAVRSLVRPRRRREKRR